MIEGKTKIIVPLWNGSDIGLVENKNDITGGNGERHNVLLGKAELATRTTCNIFEYLMKGLDVPFSYIGRDGPATFLTRTCKMIPVEVVVRRVATGSYLMRNPEVKDGFVFPNPVVEFYYKTSGRQLGNITLPCDDPLMVCDENDNWNFFDPGKSKDALIREMDGYLSQTDSEMLKILLDECRRYALEVFVHLNIAWQKLEGALWDLKLEFEFYQMEKLS